MGSGYAATKKENSRKVVVSSTHKVGAWLGTNGYILRGLGMCPQRAFLSLWSTTGIARRFVKINVLEEKRKGF